MDRWAFWALFTFILLAGFFMRFYDLTKRPIHHDEGVIGWFMMNILQRLDYTYDADYHGPFLYHFGALVFLIFGDSDFTLRAPTALANLAVILLLLPLRKKMGDAGVLAAAALLSLSPSMVYYAQRAYMDNWFILFTIGLVAAIVLFFETRDDKYIVASAGLLALLFTTKEIAFIILFILLLYGALEYAARLFAKGGRWKALERDARAVALEARRRWRALAASVAVFVIIYVAFYTTLLFNWKNIVPAVTRSLTFWLERSTTWAGHFKPFPYYYEIMVKHEHAILLLAVAASFLAGRSAFSRFALVWSLATYFIFSAIPYKTPWLDPHILLPFAVLAGTGIDALWGSVRGWWRLVPTAVLAALLGISAYNAWQITYVNYSDDREMLVYVQSLDDYTKLVQRIENHSQAWGGYEMPISVTSDEYWPLPWSLRKFRRMAFWGRSVEDQDAPVIISKKSDFSEIRSELRGEYDIGTYTLRPGVTVFAYFRRGSGAS